MQKKKSPALKQRPCVCANWRLGRNFYHHVTLKNLRCCDANETQQAVHRKEKKSKSTKCPARTRATVREATSATCFKVLELIGAIEAILNITRPSGEKPTEGV